MREAYNGFKVGCVESTALLAWKKDLGFSKIWDNRHYYGREDMTNTPPNLPMITDTSNRYSSQIKNADIETRKLLDSIIGQARWAAYINLGIHLIFFLVACAVLVWSIFTMFGSTSWDLPQKISLGGIIGSLLILILILFRNPVRVIRQPLISITSLLFIYMNFNRQIRQADAIFNQYLSNTTEVNSEQSARIYRQMQIALEEAIDQVKNLFDEL
jgi:hypothetical protein